MNKNTTFSINHDHNYYACPVSRPGSQLLILRLEWEAFNDDSDDENYNVQNKGKDKDEYKDKDGNKDEDKDKDEDENKNEDKDEENDFTLSIINFAGIQYILTSLHRSVHDKVVSIANELNLKVLPGYPLAKDISISNNVNTYHFPINCAADSIYTIEGFVDVNDESELLQLKLKESQQIKAYLAERLSDSPDNDNDIELINDSNYQYKQNKKTEQNSCI